MKLSENLNSALNQQILIELGNQTKYMQVASYFEDLQLKKLAGYFLKQADGEKEHALLFMGHINDRNGGKVTLGEIQDPNLNLSDPVSVGETYLAIEQQTTESIEALYDLALGEKSYIDLPFLSTLLQEQIEEEDISQQFALNIRMVKDIVLFDSTFGG
jgi:ferritin